MSNENRIEKGHEDYQPMMNMLNAKGGKRIHYRESDWIAVRDGDGIVFIKTASVSDVSSLYDSSSIPPHA